MNKAGKTEKVKGRFWEQGFVKSVSKNFLAPPLLLLVLLFGLLGIFTVSLIFFIIFIFLFGGLICQIIMQKIANFYKKAVEVNRELVGDKRISKNIGTWDPILGESIELPRSH